MEINGNIFVNMDDEHGCGWTMDGDDAMDADDAMDDDDVMDGDDAMDGMFFFYYFFVMIWWYKIKFQTEKLI